MRKSTLLCIILFFAVIGNAQINKGSILLGGDFSYLSSKASDIRNNSSRYRDFEFAPSFAKAIKENTFLGFNIVYNHRKNIFDNTSTTQSNVQNGWGGGIFIRKYRPLGSGPFSLFLQGAANYRYDKRVDSIRSFNSIGVSKTNTIAIGCYPGISYRINKKLQVETGFNNLISINYSHFVYSENGTNPVRNINNSFSFTSSLNNLKTFSVGFRLLLTNKKEKS